MGHPTEKRNRQILAERKKGATYAQLGRDFKVSAMRAKEIVERETEYGKMRVIPGMDVRLFNILRQALKMEHPSLVDFKRFIDANSDWRKLLRSRSKSPCGPKTIERFEEFARENGLVG
ncbi:MAG: hypothetical protein ABII71_01070 [Candidatus Micrarchaeota archaeon]